MSAAAPAAESLDHGTSPSGLKLRQDLALYPAEPEASGERAWVLHDPAANRFFRLGWQERELLGLIDSLPPEAVKQAARQRFGGALPPARIDAFFRFLDENHLLVPAGRSGRLSAAADARRRAKRGQALRQHLFLRIPLLRPDRFLDRAMPFVAWLFRPLTLWLLAAMTAIGLFLVGRQADTFLTSLPRTMTLAHWVAFGVGLSVAKVLHEFGHAFAAKRYGCRVYSMGLVLIVLWPVLYTDTTDAWKLASRRQRLTIGAAGMAVELGLAAVCLLLWAVAPPGPWRSVLFLLSSTTWALSLAVNLNPFMRFDGYYLLSDAVGVPNLQARSFALARWRLREALFGAGNVPPETARPWMIGFAFATWLYRFFLLLGIALLVYHYVFRALGAVLLAWHVWAFIGQPVWRELRVWGKLMRELTFTWRMARTLGLLGLVVAALAVPWGGRIAAPAVLTPARVQNVYTPIAGRLDSLEVAHGARVAEGAPLAILRAPDLAHRIGQLERDVRILARRQEAAALRADLTAETRVIDADLSAAVLELRQLRRQRDRTTLRAEHAGVVTNVMANLRHGAWLGANARLMSVMDPNSWQVVAYVAEEEVARVAPGQAGRFFPADGARPQRVEVVEVAPVSATEVRHPALTAPAGGALAVHRGEGGRLIPDTAVYRVRLRTARPPTRAAPEAAGRVVIAAAPESLLAAAARRLLGIWRREFGEFRLSD